MADPAGGASGHYAICVGDFYEDLAARLVEGARSEFSAAGIGDDEIEIFKVPGAFELPLAAHYCASSGRFSGVACLGAVIRGETTHDQHINRAVSVTLAEIGVRHKLPVLFGVLTCSTLEQAVARSGGAHATTGKDVPNKKIGNKGVDCAEAALEMVNLLAQLRAMKKD